MRLFGAKGLIDRARDYPPEALNELFRLMDDIERDYGLIPALTEREEEVVAAFEERLSRGEELPELQLSDPIEDHFLETNDAVLAKLSLLPKTEQDAICDILAILIDIDAPCLSLSPAQIAFLRITLKELDAEKAGNAPEYPAARPKKRLRKAQARGNRSRID